MFSTCCGLSSSAAVDDAVRARWRVDLDRRLDRIMAAAPTGYDGRKLHRRITRHRAALFTFVTDLEVPPTNNISERHLRASVIFREVANGYRLAWGAETYAAFRSLVSNAKLKEKNVLTAIQHALAGNLAPAGGRAITICLSIAKCQMVARLSLADMVLPWLSTKGGNAQAVGRFGIGQKNPKPSGDPFAVYSAPFHFETLAKARRRAGPAAHQHCSCSVLPRRVGSRHAGNPITAARRHRCQLCRDFREDNAAGRDRLVIACHLWEDMVYRDEKAIVADQPTPQPDLRGGYRALLRRREFALFFVATSVSTLGTSMIPVALTFALLTSGYTVTTVGAVFAAETLPAVVLLLVGGIVGDRWPRRLVMTGADILRCASQGLLAALLITGHPAAPVLMALAACVGIGNAFYKPAEDGLIPQAAGGDKIKEANNLISIVASLASIIGPSIAGLLVSLGGAALAIGLDAASYAVSAACLILMRATAQNAPAAGSVILDLRQGWSEFNRHRWLQLITAQFGLLNLFAFAPFFVLGPVLFASVPGGARLWGFVASASGVGGALGGLLILRSRPSRPLVVVELAFALLATPLLLLSLRAPVVLVALGSAMFGASLAVINILFSTAIQESVPAPFLSRVSSLVSVVALGLTPVGFALCGPAAHLMGARAALGAGAALLLLGMAAVMASRDIRMFKSPRAAQS
jgi:MFS family permease